MENRPYIAIMVSSRRGRRAALRLHKRFCDPGIGLYAFCPKDIRWSERRIFGLSAYTRGAKQRSFPFPQAVYNRCFNKKTDTVLRLEAAIGRDKCFNAINFFNKWLLYNLLKPSAAGIHVPDTYLYEESEFPALLERYKLLFIKPLYGSMGKFVYRAELTDNGEVHVALHSLTAQFICGGIEEAQELLARHLGNQKYLVQQGVRTALLDRKHYDIRVLMQKSGNGEWAVSNIASRVAYRHYFNTAVCESILDAAAVLSRVFEASELDGVRHTLHEMSMTAAKEAESNMGLLGELSVDYVVDPRKKLWIIELNGKPNKSIYNEFKAFAFRKRIYQRPMEYAAYLAVPEEDASSVAGEDDDRDGYNDFDPRRALNAESSRGETGGNGTSAGKTGRGTSAGKTGGGTRGGKTIGGKRSVVKTNVGKTAKAEVIHGKTNVGKTDSGEIAAASTGSGNAGSNRAGAGDPAIGNQANNGTAVSKPGLSNIGSNRVVAGDPAIGNLAGNRTASNKPDIGKPAGEARSGRTWIDLPAYGDHALIGARLTRRELN